MAFDDLDNHVGQSRTFSTTGFFEFLFNVILIPLVTRMEPMLKPADCFGVTQNLLGPLEIQPAKSKPAFERSKIASQNVIESVEILSPFNSWNHACRNFVPKVAQAIESSPVDFNDRLWHPHGFSAVSLGFIPLLRWCCIDRLN